MHDAQPPIVAMDDVAAAQPFGRQGLDGDAVAVAQRGMHAPAPHLQVIDGGGCGDALVPAGALFYTHGVRAKLLSCALWTVVALLTVAVFVPILFCSLVLRPVDPQRRLVHRLGTWWGCALVRLNPFWRLRVRGREHLRSDRAYVLIANHQSLADIVMLYTLRRQFKWLAKRSLFAIPFLGWSMGLAGYIPLERGRQGSITHSYRRALAWLQQGMSVIIFPEGTRSRTGELGAFKNGAFTLALQAGVPLLPIALAGTRDAMPRGSWAFDRRADVTLLVLPPLDTTGAALDQAVVFRDRARAAIRDALARCSPA